MDRTRYNREWARRKRQRRWAQEAQTRRTCPKRFGRYGECGSIVDAIVLPGGTVRLVCPRCERQAAGLCCDCPARVDGQVGKARRCAPCRRMAIRRSTKKYQVNNRRLLNRKSKRYARQHRQEMANYKRLWRQANPEKVKAAKRRYAERHRTTVLAYHAAHRQAHPYLAQCRTLRHALKPRTCLMCPTVVTGRAKKCAECKANLERSARRWLGWAA